MKAKPSETEDILVIFGAKVNPDGTPSGAVQRRVAAALDIASSCPNPVFLVTGAGKAGGPAEAVVMKQLLQAAGVPKETILVDDISCDTLASVVRSAEIIRARGPATRVIVCSDRYHIARCRWLFRLLGVPTRAAAVESGRNSIGSIRWAFWFVREIPATAWDTLLLLTRA